MRQQVPHDILGVMPQKNFAAHKADYRQLNHIAAVQAMLQINLIELNECPIIHNVRNFFLQQPKHPYRYPRIDF